MNGPKKVTKNIIFTIPELQEAIFRDGSLTSKDLSQATLVCRAWFLFVTPYFWENVEIDWKCYDKEEGEDERIEYIFKEGIRRGISKYGHWIKRLRTTNADVLAWLVESTHGGSRLLEIDFQVFEPSSDDEFETSKTQQRLDTVNKLISQTVALQKYTCRKGGSYGYGDFKNLIPGWMNLKPGFLKFLHLDQMVVDKELGLVLNRHSDTLQFLALTDGFMVEDIFNDISTPLLDVQTLILTSGTYRHYDPETTQFQEGLKRLLKNLPNLTDLRLRIRNVAWIPVLQWALESDYLKLLEGLYLENGTTQIIFSDEKLLSLLKAAPKSLRRLQVLNFGNCGIGGDIALRHIMAMSLASVQIS